MPVIVCREVDYIKEALTALNVISENKSWEEFRKKITSKIEQEDENVVIKLNFIETVLNEIQNELVDKQEEISYYFTSIQKYDVIPAELLLCRTAINMPITRGILEVKEEIKSYSPRKRDSCFIQHFNFDDELDQFIMGTREHPTEDLIRTKRLINNLMALPVEEKEKNKILTLYFDEGEFHLNKVLELMEEAVRILKRYEQTFQEMAEEFFCFWSKKIEQIDLYQEIIVPIGIEFSAMPADTMLIPWFFNLSALAFHCVMEEGIILEDLIQIRIGILFSENFWIFDLFGRFNKEELYQAMKLLSDKSKFEILAFIKDKQAYGAEIAKQFNLSTPTISHHMNGLLKQGLVKIDTRENRIYYSTNKENLRRILSTVTELLS